MNERAACKFGVLIQWKTFNTEHYPLPFSFEPRQSGLYPFPQQATHTVLVKVTCDHQDINSNSQFPTSSYLTQQQYWVCHLLLEHQTLCFSLTSSLFLLGLTHRIFLTSPPSCFSSGELQSPLLGHLLCLYLLLYCLHPLLYFLILPEIDSNKQLLFITLLWAPDFTPPVS